MARPRTYEVDSRAHIGVRYDRDLIKLFDEIAAKQGMTRNMAIEICIKQVVQNQRVPDSYFPDLEQKLTQIKEETTKPSRVKDRILEGSSRDAGRDRSGNKGSKITQSL